MLCLFTGSAMLWPWLAASALSLASLLARAKFVEEYWAAPFWASMTVPMAVLLLVARLCTFSLLNPNPSVVEAPPAELPGV
jgi:biopolymer transport protein ExbB/TolQ